MLNFLPDLSAWYGFGDDRMFAECSFFTADCQLHTRHSIDVVRKEKVSYLAVLTPPDKVRLAPAARNIVVLESADTDPVWV